MEKDKDFLKFHKDGKKLYSIQQKYMGRKVYGDDVILGVSFCLEWVFVKNKSDNSIEMVPINTVDVIWEGEKESKLIKFKRINTK